MASEGTIEIELAEFWQWVAKQHPDVGEIVYGVPRVNKSNNTLEIDFAASTGEGSISQWAVEPKAVKQWQELK